MGRIWTEKDFSTAMPLAKREAAARAMNAPIRAACLVLENSDQGYGWKLPPILNRDKSLLIAPAAEENNERHS
ncbi:MAG: hypothetical protein HQL91_11500 [Magnetococcales bacterium]|nr:hypothetical protein [Magnetococcales bacterium]